jgi:glycosyltransferase involved in cell wall biosynthesis
MNSNTRIAWISNLPLTPAGGGTLAVNFQAHEALGRLFTIVDTAPIPIRADRFPALVSKVRRRILHLPGSFPVFSRSRLEANAREIEDRLTSGTDLVFFKGVTPWIAWKPDRPYVTYTDIAFATFFENTFEQRDFHRADIERILDAERTFLEGAAAVFFESQWGLEKTKAAYDLSGSNFICAGRGGNLPVPDHDRWDGRSRRIVTMAKHFRQKGGDLVLEAYRTLKPEFPELSWSILGGEPDFDWKGVEGVTWEGFLNPADPAGLARMLSLLGNAWLLLHPTREDTNPLVITEAAAFGCPCVSVRKFAIPELVKDGETGILLKVPFSAETLAEKIRGLLRDPEGYRKMRRCAREFATGHFGWEKVAATIAASLPDTLDGLSHDKT